MIKCSQFYKMSDVCFIMELPDIVGEGIALDIDETLSNTIIYLVEQMMGLFGNPEKLSAEEIIKKYRYTWNVPYWKSSEAVTWLDKVLTKKDIQLDFSVCDGAKEYVKKIHEIVPIVAYITARPEMVSGATKIWLDKHGFPDAPIICKSNTDYGVHGNEWKAGVLKSLYPKVKGIVDDNAGLTEFLEDYEGHVFLYNNEASERGISCSNWEAVYDEIKKKFG